MSSTTPSSASSNDEDALSDPPSTRTLTCRLAKKLLRALSGLLLEVL